MSAEALRLFADLGITHIPPNQQRQRGPMETNCLGIVARIIRKFGLPHTTLTLRTIVESSEGNRCALIADIIDAISDVILSHSRWANLGLEWLAAFDQIDLTAIRRTVKAANVQPLRVGIAVLICLELEKILGPSRPPKPARPIKVKLPPKSARSLSRIPEVRKNIEIGLRLRGLALNHQGELRLRSPGATPVRN